VVSKTNEVEYFGTPFESGDEFATAYLNTSVDIDLSTIDFGGNNWYPLLYASAGSPTIQINARIEDYDNKIYTIEVEQSSSSRRDLLYLSKDYEGYKKGWYSKLNSSLTPFSIEPDAPFDISTMDGTSREYIIEGMQCNEVLSQFLSKTPFEVVKTLVIKANNFVQSAIEANLPKATIDDRGKFLRVDESGKIVLESLLIGEELSV
jgi:hypothetical protein